MSLTQAARPVFGFVPSAGDLVEAVEAVLSVTMVPRLVVTPNLDHVVRLRRDEGLREAYRRAAMVLCDGFPVHAYARLHAHRAHRVTGCDLAVELLRRRPDVGARWFFVVDTRETARAVRAWAEREGVTERVGVAVPPFGFVDEEAARAALTAEIAGHGTTLLVMGVGAPQSEVFVDGARATLPPCWAICVGQAVKVALGLVRRAPAPLRALQLEWFWRVCQEPRRLGRRYALGGLRFVLAVADDLLGGGRAVELGR